MRPCFLGFAHNPMCLFQAGSQHHEAIFKFWLLSLCWQIAHNIWRSWWSLPQIHRVDMTFTYFYYSHLEWSWKFDAVNRSTFPCQTPKKNAQHITELIQDIHQDVLSRLPEPWDVAKVQVEMMIDDDWCLFVLGRRWEGFWLLQQQQQPPQSQSQPQQPFMSHVLLFTLIANILKPFRTIRQMSS